MVNAYANPTEDSSRHTCQGNAIESHHLFPPHKEMHKVIQPESFFNKAIRVGEQDVQLMGTLKGAWEAGKTATDAFQRQQTTLDLYLL